MITTVDNVSRKVASMVLSYTDFRESRRVTQGRKGLVWFVR